MMLNDSFTRAIDEFGRRLGLATLALDTDGRVSLTLSDFSLSLEAAEDETALLMTLGLPLEPSAAPFKFREALERASRTIGLRFSLSPSLFRDNLLLTVAIDERDASAATLENVLRFLLEEVERYR